MILLRIIAPLVSVILFTACTRINADSKHKYNTKIPAPANVYLKSTPDYTQTIEKISPQELAACHALQPNIRDSFSAFEDLEHKVLDPDEKLQSDINLARIKRRQHLIFGVDPNSTPFSYTNPQLSGLFIRYAKEINQRLFPHSAPEFHLISDSDDARQQLANQSVDLILAPYPITCELAQNYVLTNPIYTSTVAVATFDEQKLNTQTHQKVCLADKSVMKQIILTALPYTSVISSQTSIDCLVAIQQGAQMLAADSIETILSAAPYSSVRNLTSIAVTYFSPYSTPANTNLIKLINHELVKIRSDRAAVKRLAQSLYDVGVLPNTSTLSLCKYELNKIKGKISDEHNLSLELSKIENNLLSNGSNYSPYINFCHQKRNAT